jgi:tryptophan synthase alpha chain
MSRLALCFATLKEQGKAALIPYITAGDPVPTFTVDMMHHMVASGADIIELGVPFSDPAADGPTIQLAMERALAYKVSLTDVLAMVNTFRQQDNETPVVLMGYLNPIEKMGYLAFAKAAVAAGVDGVLTVDLPPEEATALSVILQQHQLDSIFLAAPTSNLSRLKKIAELSSGFLYYVSLKGITGSNILNVVEVEQKLKEIRDVTDLPIGVGFGIKDASTAAAVGCVADAVVVGSALVKHFETYEKNKDAAHIQQVVGEVLLIMRQAMDEV